METTTTPSAAERMAIDNLRRRKVAARLGAALIMVPLVLGLLIFWLVMVGLYVESVAWYNAPDWRDIQLDAKTFLLGPIYAVVLLHVILIVTAWYAGRQAGIHVLHHGRRTFLYGITMLYIATLPALILTMPLGIGFTSGFDEVADLFARHFDDGALVACYLALLNLVPALLLGGGYGLLLSRVKKRQGNALRVSQMRGDA